MQICVKQVVWSSGIQWNPAWATYIVIDTLVRVQRGKKLVSSDQKLVAKNFFRLEYSTRHRSLVIKIATIVGGGAVQSEKWRRLLFGRFHY